MLDYMKYQGYDEFLKIPEACEFLGFTKDELKAKCEQYGVEVRKWLNEWGFPAEALRQLNNTLYYEQCRDGINDSHIWEDIHAVNRNYLPTQINLSKPIEENPVACSYIKNIRGLKGSYTYEEACQLLGITPEKLREIYNQYDFPTFANSVGTPIMTCYDFLTINNQLYREQCKSPIVYNP